MPLKEVDDELVVAMLNLVSFTGEPDKWDRPIFFAVVLFVANTGQQ
jgi:hypothetical protein